MSPLVDGEGRQREEIEITVLSTLEVRRIVVRHAEVSLFDADGRESVLIQRPTHPGAGLSLDLADHVETTTS